MPIYPLECTACGHIEEMLTEIKDRNDLPSCKYCGSEMRRAMELQNVIIKGDIEPGFDESLGEYIGSRKELRERLAYHNAYNPDLMIDHEPSAGRLTSEERAIVEGRPVQEKKTIFDRRQEPGWGQEPTGTQDDMISTEGQIDRETINQSLIADIKERNK